MKINFIILYIMMFSVLQNGISSNTNMSSNYDMLEELDSNINYDSLERLEKFAQEISFSQEDILEMLQENNRRIKQRLLDVIKNMKDNEKIKQLVDKTIGQIDTISADNKYFVNEKAELITSNLRSLYTKLQNKLDQYNLLGIKHCIKTAQLATEIINREYM